MKKVFKNLIPFWKMVLVILVFLVVQAVCDLSLPSYTSKIIDTGIQNSGVEHVMPQSMTEEDYDNLKIFLTDKEEKEWDSSYKKDKKNIYQLQVTKNSELEKYDDKYAMVLLLNQQMSAMDEKSFRQMMAQQMKQDVSMLDQIPLEQLAEQTGVVVSEKKTEDEDGKSVTTQVIDVRPLYKNLLATGMLTDDVITTIRDTMQEKMSTMGNTMIQSSAIAGTIVIDENAGMDMEQLKIDYLWLSGAKMLALALIMAVATIVVGFFASKIGAGIGKTLRADVFKKVVRFSNTEMDQFSTASLITRSTNDVQQIQQVTTLLLRMVAYAPILGIGGIIQVWKTGAGMGWVIGLAVLVILGIVGCLMAIAMPKFKAMQTLIDKVNLVSREILTGLSVIRAFGREKKEEERFDEANKELTATMLFTNRVMTFMMPGMMLVMYGLTVLIVWVAAHKIDSGVMEVGSMTAFITYAMLIVMSFLMLTVLSIMLPRAAVAANRIEEVQNTICSIEDPEKPEHVTAHKGVVEFKSVSFKYQGANENALENISFKAEPGKTTAIIGSTGCGKSTLVQLIPRLYDVTDGSVTMDGVDVRNLSMKDLRAQIGFVPQKGILFSGTIASNLRFGNKNATQEEIAEAAEIAQATEFIEKKEDAYESAISQGGSNVSGGQKQRLAIARAIAKKAKVYIFDDSFSALDLKTDAAVRKALGEKIDDATVIIVAQRISTILHADQIIVLDDGKIVGMGTHEQLLKDCEVYLQIATSQLSEKELGLQGKEEKGNE